MDLLSRYNEFIESISDEPYYRIYAIPENSGQNVVSTKDSRILNILYKPPNNRRTGFGVTRLWDQEMYQSKERITGRNITGGDITLLNNGYFEVICPINTQFQRGWGDPQFGIAKDVRWLYPYVVIEFPISFLRLMKAIYNMAGIESDVYIQQDYHNITGYALPEGPPTSPFFGIFLDERGMYENSEPINSKARVRAEEWVLDTFVPDQVAYDLISDVYAEFGILDDQAIPAFDENRMFILE